MNRKLLAILLQNNIEELSMITNSFIELNEYPLAIIHLAKRKTEDIESILDQLSNIKQEVAYTSNEDLEPAKVNEIPVETVIYDKDDEKPEESELTKTLETERIVEKLPELKNAPTNGSNIEITPKEEKIAVEVTKTIELSESVEELETTVIYDSNNNTVDVMETHEITTTVEESRTTTLGDRISTSIVSRNEVMSKADNSISASIANKKINDIKQAISIGDRFRFQRELFKGNGEDMNKTLNYINQLATQDEVISFLKSKYKWDGSNENTEDFYQIVRRKFL